MALFNLIYKVCSKIRDFVSYVFFGVLGFFGLIDANRELSRTNLLLYVFTYKFMNVQLTTTSIGEMAGAIATLAGLGGAMGLYAWKKKLTEKAPVATDTVINKIRESMTEDATQE